MSEVEDTLALCRKDIDAIDKAIVDLLQKRFRVVDRVVAIKRRDNLPASIPSRIEEVVANVRSRAEQAGVPPDAAEAVWRQLIAATIAYERSKSVRV